MFNDVRSNINNLTNIPQSDVKNEKIIDGRISALEKSCIKGFSPESEHMREKAIKALENLKSHNLSVQTVEKVSNAILTIQKAPHNAGPARFAVICDIDSPDSNGAIFSDIVVAAKDKVPFITSREMITNKNQTRTHRSFQLKNLSEELLKKHADWNVYEYEGYLAFIPKEQSLDSLDLKTDGTLKPISMLDALQGSKGKKDMPSLIKMFSDTPTRSKLLYLSGHGGSSSVAGISNKDYLSFLGFLKTQKCAGLTISSCYSGGASSLSHQPSEDIPGGISFPVIVRSIGDFPTKGAEAEKQLQSYFKELTVFLEGPQTLQQAKKMLTNIEKGMPTKVGTNLNQIYFPHSPGSPGGFRPIGEGGASYSLTYAKLKPYEGAKKAITIPEGVKYVELHPLIIRAPLVIHEENAVLLSMIPSNSRHMLASIQLQNITPLEFLQKTATLHKEWEANVNKSFFIGDLSGLNEVVLSINDGSAHCFYKENGSYFYRNLNNDGEDAIPITAFQYALEVTRIEKNSRGDDAAVRAATAGQESEADFVEQLYKNFPTLAKLAPSIKKEQFADMSFSQQEKESLVFYLMANQQSDQALQLFKASNLSSDCKNLFGDALVYYAVKNDDLAFVKQLQGMNVQFNVPGLLNIAVKNGNEEMVSLILDDPKVDVNIVDSSGWTPIVMAVGSKPALFKKLIDRGADVDIVTNDGFTLLSEAVYFSSKEGIDQLLEAGADPNLGNPSALKLAILSDNLELVKRFIAADGKAFEKDVAGTSPFVEALKRSDVKIVEYFLTLADCEIGPEVIAAAIQSANSKKIELIQNRGVIGNLNEVQEKIQKELQEELKAGIDVFLNLGEWKIVQELIHWLGADSVCAQIVGDALITTDPKRLEEFVNSGLLKPECILPKLVAAARDQFAPYKEVLKVAMENDREKATASLIAYGNVELLKFLQSCGVSIGTESACTQAIMRGNFAALKMVEAAGGTITTDLINNNNLLLQAYQRGGKELFLHVLSFARLDAGLKIPARLWMVMRTNNDIESFTELVKKASDLQTAYEEALQTHHLPLVVEVEKIGASRIVTLSDEKFYKLVFNNHNPKLLRHFFDKGYDPNMVVNGSSLLVHAITENSKEALQVLLDLHVDPNQMVDKYSCLEYAVEIQDAPVVKMLLDAGAKISPATMEKVKGLGDEELLQLFTDKLI